jgi:transposase
LFSVLGVDLTQIHGLGPSLVLKLVGECGTALSPWPDAKHFTSWLCLAPKRLLSPHLGLQAGVGIRR